MITDIETLAGLHVRHVLAAYETAAYWSSNSETDDAGGEPLDIYMAAHGTEASEACLARFRDDVVAFLRACEREGLDLSTCDAEQVGYDFWLTRNGHGTGFWDRDDDTYGTAEVRDRLDALALSLGETSLYVNTETNTVETD